MIPNKLRQNKSFCALGHCTDGQTNEINHHSQNFGLDSSRPIF